jgi:hypothetical protein
MMDLNAVGRLPAPNPNPVCREENFDQLLFSSGLSLTD